MRSALDELCIHDCWQLSACVELRHPGRGAQMSDLPILEGLRQCTLDVGGTDTAAGVVAQRCLAGRPGLDGVRPHLRGIVEALRGQTAHPPCSIAAVPSLQQTIRRATSSLPSRVHVRTTSVQHSAEYSGWLTMLPRFSSAPWHTDNTQPRLPTTAPETHIRIIGESESLLG